MLICQAYNHPFLGSLCWVYFYIPECDGYWVDGMADSQVNGTLGAMKILVSTHSLRKGLGKEGEGVGVGIYRVTL